MFSVREFGARGDKQSNDQAAIQAAIDACRQAGGGRVTLPAGDYLSGMLRLYDHTTLHLDAGATLWASTDPADYAQAHDYERSGRLVVGTLLVADGAQHIALTGTGIIHGQGSADYGTRWGAPDTPPFRTGICLFENCHQVKIRDVTILHSDAWTVHLKHCESVFIDGVTILNNRHRLNSDGIDPNSCRDVHISNCHIIAGDDCIVLKSTEPAPCENIVITNCTLETTCTAIKLGTESFGDFRDILVSNCVIRNTRTGIGFYLKDGATMERITFSGLTVETEDFPIFIDVERRYPDSRAGTIRDVTLHNVQIKSSGGALIQGMPESAIENLTLQTISLRIDNPRDHAMRTKPKGSARCSPDARDTLYACKPSYLTLAHINGLTLDNIRIATPEEGQVVHAAVGGYHLQNGILRNVRRLPGSKDDQGKVIELRDCNNISILD